MTAASASPRAQTFLYAGVEVDATRLVGHYELDGRLFREVVSFDGVDRLDEAAAAAATLWYLVAGLSYYKVGAAKVVDLGDTAIGPAGRALLEAALRDGLGEFAWRNALSLDDVEVTGGVAPTLVDARLDQGRVLTPFGGGIDSVVTVESLNERIEQALFVVSPSSGRFESLEASAAVTRRDVVRATRTLDADLASAGGFTGHVPVTAMVTLLAATAAVATGRGGVVMSNEHSASVANLVRDGREVNHQWSKSFAAEILLAGALSEAVGPDLVVASFLRDRSELWVARAFANLVDYHPVFRSCNRAFAQEPDRRATRWCLECDKCLFVALVLAPFVPRGNLAAMLGGEPLADPERAEQLRTLVGLGERHKPFECVGDPDESAVALGRVSQMPEWANVAHLAEISRAAPPRRSFDDLLEPDGPTRAAPHWLR
jgi:UDP-N-acetyl-alpha-D-muramoyl-L-alanyl-L-glutamate epimerase